MVAAKVGNYTLVEDECDFLVARTECLCSVDFQHYYIMLPHCHLGVDVSLTAGQLEPYWLSSAEIRSSRSYVNKTTGGSKISIQVVI
jgi:hypothetical protein